MPDSSTMATVRSISAKRAEPRYPRRHRLCSGSSGEEIHVRLIAQGTALSEARINSVITAGHHRAFMFDADICVCKYATRMCRYLLQAPPLYRVHHPLGQPDRPAVHPLVKV